MNPEMQETARNILWYFGDRTLGWQPGSFTESLLRTIQKADAGNRRRLALGFPEEVSMMVQAAEELHGLDALREAVQGS
jgi:hypothetical protein